MITKTLITGNFSKYAKWYDQYCSIQNLCASKLDDRIGDNNYSSILEIGCGTGNYTSLLRNRFPATGIKALDISADMVEIARAKIGHEGIEFIVADAESMNLEDKFDFISSNATFQWFQNLEQTLKKCRDLLDNNGVMLFSMFGPSTFVELDACLKELYGEDISISSGNFVGKSSIEQALKSIFGKGILVEEEILTEHNESLLELLTKIKYTGTRGNGTRHKGIWTPRTIESLENIYRRRYGQIVATYQVLFCKAGKKLA